MKFFDKSDGVSPEEYLKNHETHHFGYGSGMKNVYFGGRSGGWMYIDKDIEYVEYDELVAFDRLCDEIRDRLIWYCDNAKFEKRIEMIPREYEAMILPGDEEEET